MKKGMEWWVREEGSYRLDGSTLGNHWDFRYVIQFSLASQKKEELSYWSSLYKVCTHTPQVVHMIYTYNIMCI